MATLTNERVSLLKREMNFLLWTTDPPQTPEGMVMPISGSCMEAGQINMQCVSHSYITAGLLQSYQLTLVKGQAFIADVPNECLHQIPVHFWIVFNDQGIADFSLHGETGAPAVFGDKCVPEDWRVDLTQDSNELNTMVHEPGRNCIYFPIEHWALPLHEISSRLDQPFDGAIKQGIILPLRKILAHCDRLLQGTAETLTTRTQAEAWRTLAS